MSKGKIAAILTVGLLLGWSVPAALSNTLRGRATSPSWAENALGLTAAPPLAVKDEAGVDGADGADGPAGATAGAAGMAPFLGGGPDPSLPAGDAKSAGGIVGTVSDLPADLDAPPGTKPVPTILPVLADGEPSTTTTAPPADPLATPAPQSGPPATAPAAPARPADYSIRLVYAVPRDGTARDGAPALIRTSIEAVQRVVAAATGGHRLRVDGRDGVPAVDSIRLSGTDAQMAAAPGGPQRWAQADLQAGGRTSATTLYAVYYEGTQASCEPAAAPAAGPHVVVLSLSGPCGDAASPLLAALGASSVPAVARSIFLDPPPPSPLLPPGWKGAV